MERSILREVFSWIRTFIIAIVVAVVLNNTLIASAIVISGSMESTIMTDSRVLGLRVAYILNEPARFDIILFEPPYDATSMPVVKRIIGLPGEHVVITDGRVYINGSDVPLDEPFLRETAFGSFGPFDVPENSYFVLGDNRNRSSDSRHWDNSFVQRESIIGRLLFEFFPRPQLLR